MKKRILALAMILTVLCCAWLFAPAAQAAGTAAATKYPIVLVHGAGFRDKNFFINYWGRIPRALEAQGAKIFYGSTDGWGNVESNAQMLKKTVEKVLAQTGSAKVNIIAHSKGGLEARYMISSLGMAGKVASLTTVATPHHGSSMSNDFGGLRGITQRISAFFVNAVRFFSGDRRPDFYTASRQMAPNSMDEFNAKNPDRGGVYYQSFAGAVSSAASDLIVAFPGYMIRKEGENDGVVSVSSARWTNFRGVLRGAGAGGISHLDEVDFRRRDIKIQPLLGAGTVREFYVAVAADLKAKGY